MSVSGHNKDPSSGLPRTQSDMGSMTTLSNNETNANAQEPAVKTPSRDDNLVQWRTEDPEKPINLPLWRKITMTILTSCITFTISFGSSVFSATIEVTSKEFGVSEVVMLLGVSLYVLGFGLGPLIWGPASEYYGRKKPLYGGFILFAIFQIPVAVAKNLETVLICRFLSGVFASALLAINSAMFQDYWAPADRGVATSMFSVAVFAGPTLGPVVGSYITASKLGWRWTAWITLIMAVTFGIPAILFTPETYEPVLLKRRAKSLREETGNEKLHSKDEERHIPPSVFVNKYLSRPINMIILEPILLVLTLYISLIYGILYLTFYAIPYAYSSQRHWSQTTSTLPFIGILVGIFLAALTLTAYTKSYYTTRLRARKGTVHPEDRLPPMILGSLSMPVGLFWFAWCSSPSRVSSWVPQAISGLFIGFGIILIFMSGVTYIVDVYRINAGSAVSANTFIRSIAAAAFPLFAPAMYHQLGVEWATSLLGFLCTALIPAPVLFYIYGPRIRAHSKWSVSS